MSSYQSFTEWLADILVMLFKTFMLFIILRCGLILLDINVFVPILDPFLNWVVHSTLGMNPQL